MAALYTDEDVSARITEVLRRLGHDVLTAQEDGRAVVTGNRRHFHRLHRKNPSHAGIITFTDDADRPALAARIDAAISPLPTLSGQLVKVVRPNPPPTP